MQKTLTEIYFAIIIIFEPKNAPVLFLGCNLGVIYFIRNSLNIGTYKINFGFTL